LPREVDTALRVGIRIPPALGCEFRGIRFAGSGHSATAHRRLPRWRRPRNSSNGPPRRAGPARGGTGSEGVLGRAITSLEGHSIRLGATGISAKWIVGADGARSRVRGWAGLDAGRCGSRPYGFGCHYRVVAPPERVEVHWGRHCQVYRAFPLRLLEPQRELRMPSCTDSQFGTVRGYGSERLEHQQPEYPTHAPYLQIYLHPVFHGP
jgi:hypothetical protein